MQYVKPQEALKIMEHEGIEAIKETKRLFEYCVTRAKVKDVFDLMYLIHAIYTAGRVEGIRSERARRRGCNPAS